MAQLPPLTLVIAAGAAAHLRSISAYIREYNPAAALRVGDAINASIETLRRHPHIGRPGRVPGTREKSVSKYPYVIVYELPRSQPNTIEILGVYHTAQNERKI